MTVARGGRRIADGRQRLRPDPRASATALLKRYGVATRYYDPMIGAGIAELIGEKTRAILLESPGIADH